tara:strand:+ start:155 stop:319 length:165 start_codon:yes stop_codon:yes gene_type:complete
MKKTLLLRKKNKSQVEHQKSKQKMFNDIFDEPFGKKRSDIEKIKVKKTQLKIND